MGYPQAGGSVGHGGGGPDVSTFESQPDLGGFGAGSEGAINIYNTAIAQAAAEQGPGGIGQTANVGMGQMGMGQMGTMGTMGMGTMGKAPRRR